MNRLFLKIFLSFWLISVGTVVASTWINWWIVDVYGVESGDPRWDEMAQGILSKAVSNLRRGGREGRHGRRWGRWVRVFDANGELVAGRPLPPPYQHLADIREPATSGPGFAARTITTPRGRQLRLVVAVPRPPSLLAAGPAGVVQRLLVAMLVSAILCYLLSRYLTRPLTAVTQSAKRIRDGDLSARASPGGTYRRDELGQLAAEFDRMAERLEESRKVRDRLLRDLSHELRSPLARLAVAMELARDKPAPQTFDQMEKEYRRLSQMVDDILEIKRLEAEGRVLTRQEADLIALLQSVIDDANFEGQSAQRMVIPHMPDALAVEIDGPVLARALDNVIRNALSHSPAGGRVDVQVTKTSDAVVIVINDGGQGVADEHLPHLFEPFYQADPARGHRGFGIGLAIARAAVQAHGGSISAANRDQGGLSVTITLPS